MKRFKITLFWKKHNMRNFQGTKPTLKQQLNEIQTHEKVQNNAIWKETQHANFQGTKRHLNSN